MKVYIEGRKLGKEDSTDRENMKVKSVQLTDAYGRTVKVLQKREVTTTLGGQHEILRFQVPSGYLSPRNIVHMEGIEPVYTDTFIMMNPSHPLVKAPAIEGLEAACMLNLRGAAHVVLLGGLQLSRWIDWEEPLEVRVDRGWFKLRKAGLLDAILKSGVMTEVSGALHKPHDKKFKLVKSFKTVKNAPVLQVTLWGYKDEWVAELDMDLKRGVGHWREVVRNHMAAGKTHPYIVNQLLAWYWGVVSFKLEIPVVAKPG
jgi:hypothetical protein